MPLQKALDEVVWTAIGGSLTVKVAFMSSPASAKTAVSLSGTAGSMKGFIRDNSLDQLEKINAEKLSAMGAGEDLREAFLDNPAFTPVHGLCPLVKGGGGNASDRRRAQPRYCHSDYRTPSVFQGAADEIPSVSLLTKGRARKPSFVKRPRGSTGFITGSRAGGFCEFWQKRKHSPAVSFRGRRHEAWLQPDE